MANLDRARSFVDPTTNTMLVSDFELTEYLEWLRGRPVAGSRLLANFLHEWTHRWCFDSIVGSALALLRMRAACRAYRGKSAFDDYVRCMTASAILEPLAEGLALFAEFDTYPGNSKMMSQTLTAALFFFTPALDTGGEGLLPVKMLLQKLRRDPILLERKSGIYTLPLTMDNPYLLGYLSVRSLWSHMAAACGALNDRDLFLCYLRSYFYDDPGLAMCILDTHHSEVHAAEAIVNHVLSRLGELLTFHRLSEKVDRWVDSALRGAVDAESIGAEVESRDRALYMLQDALVADHEDEASLTLGSWMLMTLQERRVCVFGSSAVQLVHQAATNTIDILVKGMTEPLYSVAEEPALREQADGELIVVSSSRGDGLAVLLRVEQDVTVVRSFGEMGDDLELAKRHVINRALSASLHEEFRAGLEKSQVVATVWGFVEEQVSRAMKDLYGPLATLNASESDWPRVFEELQAEGIFGLLGQDGELTRALAALGLVNTFSTDAWMVRMVGKILDVDEDAIERAMNLSSPRGLALVARRGESVVALV